MITRIVELGAATGGHSDRLAHLSAPNAKQTLGFRIFDFQGLKTCSEQPDRGTIPYRDGDVLRL